MKRRIISLLLVFCIVLCMLPTALAVDLGNNSVGSGDCGNDLHWDLQGMDKGRLGKLTIYGTGAMKNYEISAPGNSYDYYSRMAPWDDLRQYRNIATLVLEEGLTTIGNGAFFDCSGLTGTLVLPSTLERIGYAAFEDCNFSGSVTIPARVSEIGDYAFRDSGLKSIIFEGNAPKLGTYYPFDTDATLYFHAGTTGWTDSPYYSSLNGTWHDYRIERIGGSDLDETIPGSIRWATFDARPGEFPASSVDGVYGAGCTLSATERMNGSYLLRQVPPDPVRQGYTFAGWRINFVDSKTDDRLTGQIVEDLASFDFPADLTFEAEWKEEKGAEKDPPYRIDFDPNGGTIASIRGFPHNQIFPGSQAALENDIFVDRNSGIGMMMTGADGRLDGFPVVERDGYTLLGWGVSERDLASTATVFSQYTQLTAYWTVDKIYTVTFSLNGKSGTVPQSQKVAAGGTVKLPAAPTASDGSQFICWGYTEDNKTLKEWKAGYPVNGDLTLYAAWADAPSESPSFTDVPASAYYADAVAWAVGESIVAGTSADTFSPDASCTRAQIVTLLWRAAGSPKASGRNSFTDVSSDSYYYDAILWAVEQGITAGTTDITFSPNGTVTRAQTAAFLYRAAGSPGIGGNSPFKDVASNAYYASAVQWAVDKNITAGTSTTTFSPNDDCTRAQIVTFLYRNRAN